MKTNDSGAETPDNEGRRRALRYGLAAAFAGVGGFGLGRLSRADERGDEPARTPTETPTERPTETESTASSGLYARCGASGCTANIDPAGTVNSSAGVSTWSVPERTTTASSCVSWEW
jgi:hypothetical protein